MNTPQTTPPAPSISETPIFNLADKKKEVEAYIKDLENSKLKIDEQLKAARIILKAYSKTEMV